MSYPNVPNWSAAESLLYCKCCEAISRFTQEHPNLLCSSFGFYLQPDYTSLFIAFDSFKNTVTKAKRREAEEVKRRAIRFAAPNAWQNAEHELSQFQVYAHGRNTGDFEFYDYEQVVLEGWEKFIYDFEAALPPKDDPNYDAEETKMCIAYEKYMSGHAVLIFWSVIEKLISEGEIFKLNLASPFMTGFDTHDSGPMIMVRILNWPETD